MVRRALCLAVVVSVIATVFSIVGSSASAEPAADRCLGAGTEVRVLTRDHLLLLCSEGRTEGRYRVAIGVAGTGKQREGDHKTPLGRYRLARPRASKLFGTFILIGYPTPVQRQAGLTGGDVGIHGPPRSFAFLTRLFDWTDGCIAVSEDADIEAIAAWVERTHAQWVEIE